VDQRGFDNQRSTVSAVSTVSAGEAARILDIKLATLYAYVSRGLVRSVAGASGRAHQYAVADLARLKARRDARAGHTAVAAGALDWGEPILDSAITEITPGGPVYRGHPALALARAGTAFERVAELLWTGVLPDRAPRAAGNPANNLRESLAAARLPTLPRGATRFAALSLAVTALAAADPLRFGAPEEEDLARGRALLLRLAAALALGERPDRAKPALAASSVAAAAAIALGLRSARHASEIDRILVLVADHELNASTFAARIAASAGADLYACVLAGLAVASGPRHGAASARVEALIEETGRPENARRIVTERASRGEEMPGFGHSLYRDGDPRAAPLFDAARRLAPRDRRVATIHALARAMRDAGREPPNLDAGLVAISRALRLPPGSASGLFAVGRAAGWIAHALEQRASATLLRPRARYVGQRDGDP
jgi:citrate synthase